MEFQVFASRLTGWRWWTICCLIWILTLAATIPTAGDLGLTWDEPAYRFSQLRSAQWWERIAEVRSFDDLRVLIDFAIEVRSEFRRRTAHRLGISKLQ